MKRIVKSLNKAVDLMVLILLVAAVGLAVFLQVDSNRYFEDASATKYAGFNPNFDEEAFHRLQAENPDVLGWISLDGTAISYPVVQHSEDNSYYLNRDATGAPSASGSIFLDVYSSPDFADFNSLIYGHYMEEHAMFGDLKLFRDADFLETYGSGSLYFGGRPHGLQVLGFYEVSAYDKTVYTPHVQGAERRSWLAHLKELAVLTKEEPQESDRLILLSSCAEDISGGRYALLCRLTDEVPEGFEGRNSTSPRENTLAERLEKISGVQWAALLLILILATAALYRYVMRKGKA